MQEIDDPPIPAGSPGAQAAALLSSFARAVERRDGQTMAALFTEDGVYHDPDIGRFSGRTRIAALVNNWLHRQTRDLRLEMHGGLRDGPMIYAHYVLSFRSTRSGDPPVLQTREGVAILEIQDGLIARYAEAGPQTEAHVVHIS